MTFRLKMIFCEDILCFHQKSTTWKLSGKKWMKKANINPTCLLWCGKQKKKKMAQPQETKSVWVLLIMHLILIKLVWHACANNTQVISRIKSTKIKLPIFQKTSTWFPRLHRAIRLLDLQLINMKILRLKIVTSVPTSPTFRNLLKLTCQCKILFKLVKLPYNPATIAPLWVLTNQLWQITQILRQNLISRRTRECKTIFPSLPTELHSFKRCINSKKNLESHSRLLSMLITLLRLRSEI